ncbi:hypothetical protein [Haloarcula nitratireducens]|uniref:Uncharacterized protein n=1 Tax=Haloarcula nitratireducens TaxID=2487749 RepID=A0AAW4PB98_9EURY|nr:hypothetical protein [Halomicroarcula nitratireducens]MBX0295401.1 hypothetical protein [Halomicroarcula nitratireducens]
MANRFHQLVDLLVAALIAGTSVVLWGLVVPPAVALWLATLFAAMYYFSRNPWGTPRGEQFNAFIDDLYDRYLP